MKNDLNTGAWQHNIGCPISIILFSTSDVDPKTGVASKSERISQDVNKVMHALQVIYEAEGVYVPGLAGGHTAGGHHTATTEGKDESCHGAACGQLKHDRPEGYRLPHVPEEG